METCGKLKQDRDASHCEKENTLNPVLRWKRLNSGDHILTGKNDDHEHARIFRGCGPNVWVVCIGDYRHCVVEGNLPTAKREAINEIERRKDEKPCQPA